MDANGLEPWLRPYAEYLVSYYRMTITSTYRSYTDQLNLWNNRANNPYPVAPPGSSYHQYRRAFDVTAPKEVLYAAGATWKSWGGTWHESDPIHFQA